MIIDDLDRSRTERTFTFTARLLSALHLDGLLLTGLCLTAFVGMAIVYSASGGSVPMLRSQGFKFVLAVIAMLALAQVPPRLIRMSAPWLYLLGLLLLLMVMLKGDVAMGARRWLDLGFIRFQPSEIMKIAVPLACAWYLHDQPLPPRWTAVGILMAAIVLPTYIISLQPDLGTALLVLTAGAMVLLLAGLRTRYLIAGALMGAGTAVFAWFYLLHPYQRQRVLTFLDPQNDPLGAGYHIIQSQIAIGSGHIFGKGYMNGSQAQLEFLPERSTDFIFAVIGEEMGLLGLIAVLALYAFIVGRGLYIAATAQDTFARLVAGSLSLTFAVYALVNAGMVTGLLPVVGVPLPLISYGGTSMVTLMAGFGILMAVNARRRLVGR
ncbi:MAG: rod shape-determining protein RodA [Candidatus Obscuribacterales bacterium]|nr:rod shape-determining protein RodA [Steroidobacteraceae bacterium]